MPTIATIIARVTVTTMVVVALPGRDCDCPGVGGGTLADMRQP
jgi:hypothetical protein